MNASPWVRNTLAISASMVVMSFATSVAAQQNYPARPVRIVVPFSPGGGGDTIARKIAARLSERTGVTVVVDNRAGASGNIGAELVVKSPPDGYTVLSTSSTYGIQAAIGKTPFDPVNDITPVVALTRSHPLLVVTPNSQFRTMRELIDFAKKNPGKLTYGSAGIGAIAHMNMEGISALAGIRLTHVPYKGSSQALADLMGGNIDVTSGIPVIIGPMARAGRVRVLVTGAPARHPSLPDVPTLAEIGLPGFEPVDWKAFLGPKNMAPSAVAKLNGEVNAILKEKEFSSVLEADGSTAMGGPPADLMALIKGDVERWRKLIRERQIKLE